MPDAFQVMKRHVHTKRFPCPQFTERWPWGHEIFKNHCTWYSPPPDVVLGATAAAAALSALAKWLPPLPAFRAACWAGEKYAVVEALCRPCEHGAAALVALAAAPPAIVQACSAEAVSDAQAEYMISVSPKIGCSSVYRHPAMPCLQKNSVHRCNCAILLHINRDGKQSGMNDSKQQPDLCVAPSVGKAAHCSEQQQH